MGCDEASSNYLKSVASLDLKSDSRTENKFRTVFEPSCKERLLIVDIHQLCW